jgi:drug/metabolite transporter (DMT)-like permease
MLAAVALLWGASFLFIKVAVRELQPATLILGRLGLATVALALLVPLLAGGGTTLRQIRENFRWLLVVGLVNVAVPFWLLSWGETRIDSGLASIIQASVPIFNAVVAFGFFRDVRVTGLRLLGVAIGFVGVALLVGAQPHGKVLGALAVCGMALCYAVGQLLAGRHLGAVKPPVVALATTGMLRSQRCRRGLRRRRTTRHTGRPSGRLWSLPFLSRPSRSSSSTRSSREWGRRTHRL